MTDVEVTNADLELIRTYPEPKFRVKDWKTTFSTNRTGDFWVFTAWGHTKEVIRERVSPDATVLWSIREVLLRERPDGGRFFVDSYGASLHKEQGDGYPRFVRFVKSAPKRRASIAIVKPPKQHP